MVEIPGQPGRGSQHFDSAARIAQLEQVVAQLQRRGARETVLSANWNIQIAVDRTDRSTMIIFTSLDGTERILIPMPWDVAASVRKQWDEALAPNYQSEDGPSPQ